MTTETDKPYFWHGFANMADMGSDDELVIVRGEGCEVFDRGGRRYLDAIAALWFCRPPPRASPRRPQPP